MLKELDFSKHNVSDFVVGLKEMLLEEITDRSRELVKEVLERCVWLEFQEYLQAGRYERREGRRDHRNGYRSRGLMSTWGCVENIRVPRSRRGGFQPRTFARYKRVQPRVDDGVLKMFLMGVSTRKVGDVLHSLLNYTVSASYVSKVAKRLDAEVKRFFQRPLSDQYRYLFLDGVVLKARDISAYVKRTVLVSCGLRDDGSRELIDFRVGKGEGKGAWTSFYRAYTTGG